MENQIIQINLVPNMSTPAVVSVSQYDVGRPLVFKVYDGTSPADLTGVTAVIEGTKRSGLGFSESGTVSDNTVTLDTTLAMTQEDGSIPAEIRFTKTGEYVGTANFILAVEKTPHAEGTTDGTHETMADLQSQLDALDERVEALEAGSGGSGLTDDIKTALLQIAQKVAYIDEHGQTYYNNLYDALYAIQSVTVSPTRVGLTTIGATSQLIGATVPSGGTITWTSSDTSVATVSSTGLVTSVGYGTATITASSGGKSATCSVVVSQAELEDITAVYTQSGTVYNTDTLDSLKADLVVTANYSGGTSETVPGSDYTLSGTLTVGTSTVTVNYEGLTTTFSVTVSEQRFIPSQYTWLYDPRNNVLFSESGYVTKETGGTGGTETLSNGELVLNTNYSSSSQSNLTRFNLNDTTTTNGILSCRALINECFVTSSKDSPTSYRLQLSNGSAGAQAFVAENDGLISIIYFAGSSKHKVNTEYSMDEYHVFELSLANGAQTMSIDGEQIFTSSTLSSNYCAANAIFNQAGKVGANPNGTNVSVDWIAYYEVA